MLPVQQGAGAQAGSGGIRSAYVEAAASGNTQLVAAIAGVRIRVVSALVGPVGAAVNTKFQSGSTDISPTARNAANGGWQHNAFPGYLCETAPGEPLNINLSADASVPVTVTYMEVD
jgi:hypothetical protein